MRVESSLSADSRSPGALGFVPIALAIALPLTALDGVLWLRIALLVPLGLMAANASPHQWRLVLQGPIGVLFAAMAASMAWSEQPLQTLFSLGNVALETLAALAAVALGGQLANRYLGAVLKAFLVASVLTSLFWSEVGRMTTRGAPWQGVFSHKNSLGTVAAFAVVLLATTGTRSQRFRWIALAMVVLVASRSRAGLAAAVTGLLVQGAAWLTYTRRIGRKPVSAAPFYAVLALGGLVVWRFAPAVLSLLDRGEDLSGRTDIWSVVLDYGRSHLLLGSGLGAQIYDGSALARRIEMVRGTALGTTHNGFLVVYLGLGVVGMVLFVMVIAKLFVVVERARRSPATNRDHVTLALGMLACYLVINMAEDQLFTRSGWFFVLFGTLLLVREQTHSEAPVDPSTDRPLP